MKIKVESDLASVVQGLDCAVVTLNSDSRVEYTNSLALSFWQVGHEFFRCGPTLEKTIEAVKHTGLYDVTDEDWAAWLKKCLAAQAGDDPHIEEFTLVDDRVTRTRFLALHDGRYLITHYDITELKRRELEIKRHAETLEVVQESVEQGLTWFDDNLRLRAFNGKLLELLDFPAELFKLGQNMETLFRFNAERGEYGEGDVEQQVAERIETVRKFEPHEFERTRADGRIIQIKGTVVPQGGFVTTYTDVTEHRLSQRQIEFLAHHDSLTKLPNRVSFSQDLKKAMSEARTSMEACALVCFDLDHFKQVNDSLGHPAGDTLLVEFGTRAVRCLGEAGQLYRLGGDEFAAIFSGSENVSRCSEIAASVVEAASWPFHLESVPVRVGASAGIAVFQPGVEELDHTEILRQADVALYNVKRRRRGGIDVYEKGMGALVDRRFELERDLRNALENEEIFVVYQPFVTACSHAICGVEALVRWQHPTHGVIEPGEFVSLAEETGLIGDIGMFVLKTATKALASLPSLRLAVNLSPVQFRQNTLVEQIRRTLNETGFDPERLELEITENVLLADTPDTLDALTQLQGLGVSIVLDDFGTGYSSLIYLHSFKFDKIKIDRHFVRDCHENEQSLAIVRSILSLSKTLGIRSQGEGIEAVAQARVLESENCDELQGFLYGLPMRLSALQATLADAAEFEDELSVAHVLPVAGVAQRRASRHKPS